MTKSKSTKSNKRTFETILESDLGKHRSSILIDILAVNPPVLADTVECVDSSVSSDHVRIADNCCHARAFVR